MSTAVSQFPFKVPQRVVVMGVTGCGKSAVGEAVAKAVERSYIDGDDLHPVENVVKMSRGEPLTDDDRWPWLTMVGEQLRKFPNVIIGCSSLKRSYRDYISQKAQGPVLFIYLKGAPELIARRMASRSGHFMPTALLQSQFEALEPPEEDELAVSISIDQPIGEIVQEITLLLGEGKSRSNG